MKNYTINTIALLLLIFCFKTAMLAQPSNTSVTDFNAISEKLLENIKAGRDTRDLRDQLAGTNLKELENGLQTDEEKLAFWVNVYNAYIQVILREHPEFYEDRAAFFQRDQITIAGEIISFAKIEHGIIRKSQWELGLGLIRKWFPDKFERKLRVKKRNYHIHFALNCGAKDCPPVAIYTPERLDEQFDKGTKNYLERTSKYNPETKEVAVTSLFNWFRGDFGCKSGVKDILKEYGVIPEAKGVKITYANYDWTLDLDNFTNL